MRDQNTTRWRRRTTRRSSARPRSRRRRPTRRRPRRSRSRSASRPSTPGRPRSCRRSTRPRSTGHRPGPLAQAQAQMDVLAAQAELAKRQAELRQRQLVAEVIRPAEADAEKTRILAEADARRIRLQAEAAASHDRVALDRMLIDQLPQIVREAAAGLAGANVSVLNGADGLSEIAAGLVGQGLTILESVKSSLSGAADASRGRGIVQGPAATDGQAPPDDQSAGA